MNITEISIKRPSLIIVMFGVFTLLGWIGFKNLSYELMPDFNQPVVVIKTGYPGADPEEVETSVSEKIEDALSNLEGIDYRSEEHTSELQSRPHLVCRLLLEKKNNRSIVY